MSEFTRKMNEKIIVVPKTKILSPPELLAHRNIEINSLRSGLKKVKPSGTPEEAEELAKIYAELKKQISIPRIDRIDGRSEGEWDSDRNAVKVLRKSGKFEVFGYSLNGDYYLEDYEALFLLELNRINILYNSMSMSIEQGYCLFLGEEESIKFNSYLVYSMFSRIGYIVQKYQNLPFSPKAATFEECIWSILENSIHNKDIPEHIENSEHFIEVKKSMKSIKDSIINQETNEPNMPEENSWQPAICFEKKMTASRKRKAKNDEYSSWKRPRYSNTSATKQHSFIDILTKEDEYKKFEELFQSFDIIKLKPEFEYSEPEVPSLDIQFDIHLHNDNFKKSEPKPPTFRLAILDKGQDFPNRSIISKCYHSQEYQVPIMVVSVSDSKHIQAFLYYFT